MTSPTALLPTLLLLTISTLSLTFPDQPSTAEQNLASLTSASSPLVAWTVTESSIPSDSNNLASAPIPVLITGLHQEAASSLLMEEEEEAGLLDRGLQSTAKSYAGNTITVAQTTRTIATTKIGNGTGMPGRNANGTGIMMMMSSSSSAAVMHGGGGNATVLPPEPVFATGMHTKSEAGREGGKGMGMRVLVVVGVGVGGVMVLL